ncbi:MAG: nucleotidyltransferase domain-containing protein [Burkholderiaceae bacterium]|nr:nucleotidyltransferase domain-containing protein [Burkholderiaceae bacterium]
MATMRLQPQERETIRELGLRHFGVVPRLFGSRLDESRGGGDIDLLIATTLPAAEAARKRLDLLADLWIALGERKVDILLDDGRVDAPVYRRARDEAVPV